jgi:conjugal transfer pilin signal peptidase TrbI
MKNNTEQQVSTTSQPFAGYRHRCSRALRWRPAFLTRVVLEYSTPRVVAFDMKKTLDSFMDSVSQKQLTEAQSKRSLIGLTTRWRRVWRSISSSIMWSFWFHLPWFRARPM